MAICPWDVIGGGKFQTKKQMESRKQAGEGLRSFSGGEQSEDEIKISEALDEVAAEHGDATIQAIALAYVMHKARNVFPLVGGRKVEHLEENIKALSIRLTDEQIKKLESVKPFDIGFPLNMVGDDPKETGVTPVFIAMSAPIAWQRAPKPIAHQQ